MQQGSIKDTGLSIVHEPEAGAAAVDIVIVHGLQGHPSRTWASSRPVKVPSSSTAEASASQPKEGRRDAVRRAIPGPLRRFSTKSSFQSQSKSVKSPIPSVFWPGDLLPKDCPNARIMVYGYDTKVTNLTGGTNKSSVFSHGRDLLFALERKRDQDRPLVFVAHSLGGIVVKEMLGRSSASESKALRNVVESTALVIFLGTPHRGSTELVALGEWARGLVSAFRVATNASILDTLGLRTSDLERVQETFSILWQTHDFRVKTFQEGLGLTGVNLGVLGNKVVPDYSSIIGDAREHAETIDANHMDMCRFTGADDPNYQKLSGEITSAYSSLARLNTIRGGRIQRGGTFSIDAWDQDEPVGRHGLSAADSTTLQSLQFPSMFNRLQSLAKPAEQTCLWLFQHPAYQDWIRGRAKERHGGLLWIKGKPGSGKSLLMKEAYLRATEQETEPYSTAAFFFSAKGDEYETSPNGLYRSLLYQLLPRSPEHIQRLAKLQQDSAVDQESALQDFLQTLSRPDQRGRRTLIFIDGLDECESKSRRSQAYFWRDLTKSAHKAGVDLNVCISSRHFPAVSVADCPEIVVEAHNSHDIVTFVDRKLSLSIGDEDHERGAIRDKILGKSAGVFLWVDLVLDKVLQKRDEGNSLQSLLRELDAIPEALESLFAQLLETGNPASRRLTLRVFQWAVLATKPLRLHEWHHILAFIRGTPPSSLQSWRDSDKVTENDEQLEKQIRTLSMGLLEVAASTEQAHDPAPDAMSIWAGAGSLDLERGETRLVQVIHESVREFFLDGPGFAVLERASESDAKAIIGAGHLSIMATCLDYIGIKELDALVEARMSARQRKRAMRLKKRVKKPSSSSSANSGPSSFSRRSHSIASFGSAWSHTSSLARPSRLHPSSMKLKSAYRDVRVPSVFDKLREWSDSAWDRDYFAQRMSMYEVTADRISLHASIHNSVMRQSATGESRVLEDYPALLFYATSELFAHARLAHEAGADPSNIIRRLQTNDMWHRWILLREDLSLQTGLLYYAANEGISSWLPPFARDSMSGATGPISAAVMDAVKRRNSKALGLLLDKYGFHEWFADEQQGPLLHALVRQSGAPLLKVLLSRVDENGFMSTGEEGSSPTLKKFPFAKHDANGQTALHIAVGRRDVAVASQLLDAGAKPVPEDKIGRRVLHIACSNIVSEDESTSEGPDYEMVKLLLEHEANVHADDKDFHTALHAVCYNIPAVPAASDPAESASVRVLDLLLEAEAQVNRVDSIRATPLHLACRAGVTWREKCPNTLAIVKRLLDAGADPQAVNNAGETPLHIAAARADGAVVAELIRRGARVDVRDSLGQVPLHHAAWAANDAAAAALLAESKDEVDAVDAQGSTPLHFSCQFFPDDAELQRKALSVVRRLLEHGARAYTVCNWLEVSPHAIAQSNRLGSVLIMMREIGLEASPFPRPALLSSPEVAPEPTPVKKKQGWVAKFFSA